MNSKKFFLLAALLVVCFGAHVTDAAAAPKPIRSCQTIDESGSYLLDRNLTATGDCLVLAADNVTVDLNGFTITGDGTGVGITDGGVQHKNITIRDGGITNFETGIDFETSAENTVERMRVVQNTRDGIRSGANSIVKDSIAFGNGRHGIRVRAGSLVAGNISSNNGSGGIFTFCPSNIVGNSVTGNGSDYISQAGCTRYNNNPEQ